MPQYVHYRKRIFKIKQSLFKIKRRNKKFLDFFSALKLQKIQVVLCSNQYDVVNLGKIIAEGSGKYPMLTLINWYYAN